MEDVDGVTPNLKIVYLNLLYVRKYSIIDRKTEYFKIHF